MHSKACKAVRRSRDDQNQPPSFVLFESAPPASAPRRRHLDRKVTWILKPCRYPSKSAEPSDMSVCIHCQNSFTNVTNICWYEFSQGLSFGSGPTRWHCHINKAIDKLNLGPGRNKSGHGNQAHSSHRKIDPELIATRDESRRRVS